MQDASLDKRIEDAVVRAFSAGVDQKRFIDVSRVPLICQSINQIALDIKEIKATQATLVTQDQFWPVKTLVYGVVALMLTSVVGALLILVINSKPV